MAVIWKLTGFTGSIGSIKKSKLHLTPFNFHSIYNVSPPLQNFKKLQNLSQITQPFHLTPIR